MFLARLISPPPSAAFQGQVPGPQYSKSPGFIARKRSEKARVSRWAGCNELSPATVHAISGRFDRAASSAVMVTGTAATSAPVMQPAASGLVLARTRFVQL